MAYEVTIGEEQEQFRTEREAVIAFCEYLMDDAVLAKPRYPVGTVFVVTHRKTGKTLLRYVVGYK